MEFDVAVTVMTPDFDRRVSDQFPDALDDGELAILRASLLTLTNRLLRGEVASIEMQNALIRKLCTYTASNPSVNPANASSTSFTASGGLTISATQIPEPSSMLLLLLAGGTALGVAWRGQRT